MTVKKGQVETHVDQNILDKLIQNTAYFIRGVVSVFLLRGVHLGINMLIEFFAKFSIFLLFFTFDILRYE